MTYCHGDALQLADGDTSKAIKIIIDSRDKSFELSKVKYFITIIGKKSNILQRGKELLAG